MKKEKTITKLCANCGEPFTIIIAKKVGCHYVAVRGWHARRYCDCCLPRALYRNHTEYQRYWWHNLRNTSKEGENATQNS